MTARRFLITGGAGLVGSTITDLLLEKEPDLAEIVIYDDFSRGNNRNLEGALESGKVRIVRGDVRNEQQMRKAMEGIDYVFHLAAIKIIRCAAEPRVANDVLVNGTLNVLEAARDAGVKKIISSSTASVYGQADTLPTNENHHPYNNRTLYGAAKAYNEGMLRSYKSMYDLDYVALRYFNIYGPRMDTEGLYTEVLVRWMQALVNNDKVIVHGDGSATVDFVYVKDVASANIAAYKSDVTDEVFNVASGVETSLLTTLQTLAHTLGTEADITYEPPRKVNGVQHRWADVSKAKNMLGWQAEFDLETGLQLLVNWWEATGAIAQAREAGTITIPVKA